MELSLILVLLLSLQLVRTHQLVRELKGIRDAEQIEPERLFEFNESK